MPAMRLALVCLAFGTLGLVGSMIGALVPALQVIYGIDFRTAMMAQWLMLVVGGGVALPVLVVMRRIGPVGTLCAALALMAAGCGALGLAVGVAPFALVLVAVAAIALGSAAVQVAGNPLAASIGSPGQGHVHLAVAQAFNALGVLIGVNLAAAMIFGHGAGAAAITTGAGRAYLVNGGMAALALGLFAINRRRLIPGGDAAHPVAIGQALTSRWAWGGAVALALYVGAEGAIGSVMIAFLHQPSVLGLNLADAGRALANLYWGGALAGRFAGSWLLTRITPARLLWLAACGAAALCVVAATMTGALAGYAALAIGVCNAIMFPTIFSLTLNRSAAPAAAVSGLLCTAIAGGALVSILVGELADRVGIAQAFVVPMLAYAVIGVFARTEPTRFTRRTNRG